MQVRSRLARLILSPRFSALQTASGQDQDARQSPSQTSETASCSGRSTASLTLAKPFLTRSPFGPRHSWRGFSTSPPPLSNLDITLQLLNQANVLQLKEELLAESELNLHIPLARLQDLIVRHGLADEPAEAFAVAQALHTSGVVLLHNGMAYLRPDEIAEMVMQLLPSGVEETQRRLAAVQEELLKLEETHSKIELSAGRKTLFLLSCGAVWLSLQIVGFIWLVWWELSWDVMEPIAYIISLCYTLIAYLYFLTTRGVFDLKPMHDHFHKRLRKDQLLAENFDERRYQYLLRLQKRYVRHLAHHGIDALSLPPP